MGTHPFHDLEKAIEEVGPRTYELLSKNENKHFYVFGCQGTGEDGQKAVADLMNALAGPNPPDFVLVLGDNFYDYGVPSPIHIAFEKYFNNPYHRAELKSLSKIPFFIIPGNHDYNFHAKYFLSPHGSYKIPTLGNPLPWKPLIGREIGINQVMHSYVENTPAKIALYKNEKLDCNTLPQWNMPYYYYSLIHGNNQIFCVDSSTYLAELLELHKLLATKENDIYQIAKKNNQAAWLLVEYDKAKKAGRKCFLASHHPPYTAGKRFFSNKYDSHHYLDATLVNDLNELLIVLATQNNVTPPDPTTSYNKLFVNSLMVQDLHFDTFFAAHDHFISYYNNKPYPANYPICLFTLGGGGGTLEDRKTHEALDLVGCHLKQHGFADVNNEGVDIYTTENMHLKFTFDLPKPICIPHSDKTINMLRSHVLRQCTTYLYGYDLNLMSSEIEKQLEKPEKGKIYIKFQKNGFKYITDKMQKVAEITHEQIAGLDSIQHIKEDSKKLEALRKFLPHFLRITSQIGHTLLNMVDLEKTANYFGMFSYRDPYLETRTANHLLSYFNQHELPKDIDTIYNYFDNQLYKLPEGKLRNLLLQPPIELMEIIAQHTNDMKDGRSMTLSPQ